MTQFNNRSCEEADQSTNDGGRGIKRKRTKSSQDAHNLAVSIIGLDKF